MWQDDDAPADRRVRDAGPGADRIAGRTVADAECGINVEPEARGVSVVFQDYALFPHLTTAQNVGFGLERASRDERRGRVARVLDLVDLTDFADRYPHELSGASRSGRRR